MRPMLNLLLLTLICILLQSPSLAASGANGGCACVVAKKLGNSLAIEWASGEASVSDAIDKAKQALGNRGYKYAFPQANSTLRHGWLVIVETEYRTLVGKMRTSYGCGFSDISEQDAVNQAVTNLQSYSWGWKSKYGYKVIERQRY
ncbi:MAG: hypothetical protein GY703_09450 [Gammaproteobacteria bacterium]|nr:hypothetical protein [Gammaproteobacteria bacterium]